MRLPESMQQVYENSLFMSSSIRLSVGVYVFVCLCIFVYVCMLGKLSWFVNFALLSNLYAGCHRSKLSGDDRISCLCLCSFLIYGQTNIEKCGTRESWFRNS